MTERSARVLALVTCMLALISIIAAAIVGVRWRHERDTFLRQLADVCTHPEP